MGGVPDGQVIEQDQVLVGGPAPDIEARGGFAHRLDARQGQDGLDQVPFPERRRNPIDRLDRHPLHAHLCGTVIPHRLGGNHGTVELGHPLGHRHVEGAGTVNDHPKRHVFLGELTEMDFIFPIGKSNPVTPLPVGHDISLRLRIIDGDRFQRGSFGQVGDHTRQHGSLSLTQPVLTDLVDLVAILENHGRSIDGRNPGSVTLRIEPPGRKAAGIGGPDGSDAGHRCHGGFSYCRTPFTQPGRQGSRPVPSLDHFHEQGHPRSVREGRRNLPTDSLAFPPVNTGQCASVLEPGYRIVLEQPPGLGEMEILQNLGIIIGILIPDLLSVMVAHFGTEGLLHVAKDGRITVINDLIETTFGINPLVPEIDKKEAIHGKPGYLIPLRDNGKNLPPHFQLLPLRIQVQENIAVQDAIEHDVSMTESRRRPVRRPIITGRKRDSLLASIDERNIIPFPNRVLCGQWQWGKGSQGQQGEKNQFSHLRYSIS